MSLLVHIAVALSLAQPVVRIILFTQQVYSDIEQPLALPFAHYGKLLQIRVDVCIWGNTRFSGSYLQ